MDAESRHSSQTTRATNGQELRNGPFAHEWSVKITQYAMLRRMGQKSRCGRLTSTGVRTAVFMRFEPAISDQTLAIQTASEAIFLAYGPPLGHSAHRPTRAMRRRKARVERPRAILEA